MSVAGSRSGKGSQEHCRDRSRRARRGLAMFGGDLVLCATDDRNLHAAGNSPTSRGASAP